MEPVFELVILLVPENKQKHANRSESYYTTAPIKVFQQSEYTLDKN